MDAALVHFGKVFGDLVTKTADGEFGWADMSQSPLPDVPSVGQALGNMVALGLV